MKENRGIEKQIAEKWEKTEIQKKLFRYAQTGRLLPPGQFNLYVK
jgi:hypothetical protein